MKVQFWPSSSEQLSPGPLQEPRLPRQRAASPDLEQLPGTCVVSAAGGDRVPVQQPALPVRVRLVRGQPTVRHLAPVAQASLPASPLLQTTGAGLQNCTVFASLLYSTAPVLYSTVKYSTTQYSTENNSTDSTLLHTSLDLDPSQLPTPAHTTPPHHKGP